MLSRLKFLPFFIVIILLLTGTHSAAAQDDPPPLDIILLLDSSGSTATERELIEKAAEFLLDYLEANTNLTGLDYRLSVVGFNQGVIEGSAIPLGRPTDANLDGFFTNTPADGDTDFKPALNYALDEFVRLKTLETGRLPIVILMTDGQPASLGAPLPDAELDSYFEGLGQDITTISDTGVQLFVVAVGDAAADEARWQNILPSEEQYVYINDSSNLSEVYWQFLSEFMGGEQDDIVQLTADQTHTVSVEPYLDEMSLTVLKDIPGTTVLITDPRGYQSNITPIRGGDSADLHEIYVISRPMKGDWEITLQNTNGRLLVTRRYPQVTLEINQPVLPVERPLTVKAFLASDSLEVINPEQIALRLIYNDSTLQEYPDSYPFTRLLDGSYEAEISGFTESGIYTLSPKVFVDGQPLESIEKEEVEVKVVHLPEISAFDVTPSEYGKPFFITYDIAYDEDIEDLIPQLEVFLEDRLIETIPIEDHDSLKTNSHEYLAEQDGDYEFTLRIQGLTPDQLPYLAEKSSEERIYSAPVLPPSEPTPITPTPVDTATIVPTKPTEPTEQPLEPSSNWFFGVLLLIVGGGIGLFFWGVSQKKQGKTKPPPNDAPNGTTDFTAKLEQLEEKSKQKDTTPATLLKQIKEVSQYPVDAQKQIEAQHTLGEVINNYKSHSPDQFYRLIAALLKDEPRNPVILKPLIKDLDSIWDGDFENSLKNAYQYLLHIGDVPLHRFDTLSREYTTKSQLFALLQNIAKVQNSASFKDLSQDNGSPEWLRALYTLLSQLNSENTEFVLLTRDCFSDLQGSDKPDIVKRLSDKVFPIFAYIPNKESSTKEDWTIFYNQLIKVAEDIEHSGIKIPEASFLAQGLRRQAQFVKQYINEVVDPRQNAVMTYGNLEIEYRVSLSFFNEFEESIRSQDWFINLLAVVYHYEGADVTDLKIKTREVTGNKEVAQQLVELPERHTRMSKNQYRVLRVPRSPVMETKMTHLFQYKSKRLRGVSVEEVIWPGGDDFGEKGQTITLRPRNKKAGQSARPYVVGRPITPEEFTQGTVAVISPLEKARQIADYVCLAGTRLVFVQGLRQSGKTTTLLQVFELIKNGSQETTYLLMNLFLEIRDNEPRFMFALDLLRCLCEELKPHEPLHEQAKALLERRQKGQDDDSFYTSLGDLFHEVAKQKIKIVLVIQEADRFENLLENHKELLEPVMDMLALLMYKGEMTVIAECDNIESQWESLLQKKYQARFQYRSLDEKGIHTFRVSLADSKDVFALLDYSPVPFTDLAKIAVWNFSGGYLSLVQLIAFALVQEWEADKQHAVFTVDDVKRIVKELVQSDVQAPLLDYVQIGFMPEEKELMYLLVSEGFIENETGILQGIYLKDEWYGDGVRVLQNRAQERGFATVTNQLSIFLQRLSQKGVLESVVINGKHLSLVRWRIGWLVGYWRQRTIVNPVKESQQP